MVFIDRNMAFASRCGWSRKCAFYKGSPEVARCEGASHVSSVAHVAAVHDLQKQLGQGKLRMNRKNEGHDGWCPEAFEGVVKGVEDGRQWGVASIAMMK